MMKSTPWFLLAPVALASPIVTRVTIGPATIRLERTTFADVAKRLGEVDVVKAGDAGGSRAQVCYLASGPNAAKYYLESGELDGTEHIMLIHAVGAGAATTAEDPIIATTCRVLAAGASALRTDRGIRLGLSRAEVERRVKMRGRDSAGVTLYSRSEAHGRGARAYSVDSWLRVRYRGNRVIAFSTGVVSSR